MDVNLLPPMAAPPPRHDRNSSHSHRLKQLAHHLSPHPSSAAITVVPKLYKHDHQGGKSPAFPTVRQYLERIGLSEVYPGNRRPPPTEQTLRTIHCAHQLTVPFENFGARSLSLSSFVWKMRRSVAHSSPQCSAARRCLPWLATAADLA